MLVATTYKYVRILLASERIITHTSERSLLKNLGSWLGRLTIAQGQPVRHKDLDIKGIIVEAFEQGKMVAVLPFVNKVSFWVQAYPSSSCLKKGASNWSGSEGLASSWSAHGSALLCCESQTMTDPERLV